MKYLFFILATAVPLLSCASATRHQMVEAASELSYTLPAIATPKLNLVVIKGKDSTDYYGTVRIPRTVDIGDLAVIRPILIIPTPVGDEDVSSDED